jgi:hypothetical protein
MSDDSNSRYTGLLTHDRLEEGVVVDNVDPDGRHRVRVKIPGTVHESSWAFPFGTTGGGSTDSGFWAVPSIGAVVVCFFVEGDVDEIYYSTAGWSRNKNKASQAPSVIQNAIAEDGPVAATLISAFSSDRFELVFDRRMEKGRLYLRSKRHEDNVNSGQALMIELDDETGMIALSAPGGIKLTALGNIDIRSATQLSLQGRVVNPMGDTI